MSDDRIIAQIPSATDASRRKMRENCVRLLESGTSVQKASAQVVLKALDDYETARLQAHYETVKSTPMAERVVAAFTKRPIRQTEEKIIRALLDNPGSTSTELSNACGWKGQTWHMRFGTMAKDREADLWPAEPAVTREGDFYCGILADLDPDGNRFTMKPAVEQAFAALGIVAIKRQGGDA